MRFVNVRLDEAIGGVLVHNIADGQGHKALAKGHVIDSADVQKLYSLGRQQVYVAQLEPEDVPENEAVARISQAIAGKNISLTSASAGRVNFLATTRGVLDVNEEALNRLNSVNGVTVATLSAHSPVKPNHRVATVKTIGLALPESSLGTVEKLSAETGSFLWVRELPAASVAVILVGSQAARPRVEAAFTQPIRSRVEELGSHIVSSEYVAEAPEAIAAAVERVLLNGVDCIIIAGETSIMGMEDTTPDGIRQAGGTIELYGAPVEPGNLLLLAYCKDVPVIGAPGCIKSRDANVVDMILPRLLAGEHLTRADVVRLGSGGLLD